MHEVQASGVDEGMTPRRLTSWVAAVLLLLTVSPALARQPAEVPPAETPPRANPPVPSDANPLADTKEPTPATKGSAAKGSKAPTKAQAKTPAKKAPAKAAPKKPPPKAAKAPAKPAAPAKAPPLPRREPVTLSARDREIFGEAMRAVERRQWSQALEAVQRTNNPLLEKIVTWAYIREAGGHVSFADRSAFILNNPTWPGLQTIQRRAEEALDDPVLVTVPSVIAAFFAEKAPLTASGKAAYARALNTLGRSQDALPLARDAWRTGAFNRVGERAFLDMFGPDLRPEDEVERLDRMLYEEDLLAADRQIARVDAATAAVARARMALISSAGNVETLLERVPPDRMTDPGLIYDRIKWRRRKDMDREARELLPQHPDRGPRPDLMWKERQVLARDALAEGNVTEAYTIAKNHGEIDAGGLADAQWFAGWVALRFLREGETALVHFEKVYDTVQVPANVSRAAYWTGRAAEFLGRPDIAADWYRKAATHVTTFYGQLSLAKLKVDPLPALSDDPVPSAAERAAFEAREITRAMRALADVNNKTYLRIFVLALADSASDAATRHMAAEFADRVGHPEWAVALSREAARDGIPLLTYGFPIPPYAIPDAPERALVLGIARQESNFDPNARSTADALGLMQLLPSTAKQMAKRVGVPFAQNRLTADPNYNLRLGSAFLDQLVQSFDGSYILAAAAYNAGPTRARQWIRQYGDPRDGQTDPVDWIEAIPFAETRAYVQRVMENTMIYRARLAKTRNIGQTLEAELIRARPAG